MRDDAKPLDERDEKASDEDTSELVRHRAAVAAEADALFKVDAVVERAHLAHRKLSAPDDGSKTLALLLRLRREAARVAALEPAAAREGVEYAPRVRVAIQTLLDGQLAVAVAIRRAVALAKERRALGETYAEEAVGEKWTRT